MNEWDDDNLLYEGPLESDLEEFDDESETIPCPACGTEVYEDSPQCPVCGEYIFGSTSSTHRWPWWWMVAAVITLVAFICYILL